MKNIIRIFTSDAKRLATNVVAVVVIMGLSVIPSLYAWFNILSNWDPYGEAATANINVVVASCDEGVQIEGLSLNIGEMVIENLKQNKTIGWVFVDTDTEAVDMVHSGECYAGLVIDESFSQDMISFLGGNIENPTLTYYENEKKNAIAPKITGKVKTTVQGEINKAFVSTIAETLMKASEHIVSTDDQASLGGAVKGKLDDLNTDLTTYITLMDSYISIMDSAGSLMETASTVNVQLESMMAAGRDVANSADITADAAQSTMDTASGMVTDGLDGLETQVKNLSKIVLAYYKDKVITPVQVSELSDSTSAVQKSFNSTMDTMAPGYRTGDIQQRALDINGSLDDVKNQLEDIKNTAGDTLTKEDLDKLDKIQEDLTECSKNIQALRNLYKKTVEPQLKSSMSAIQNSISEVQQILNYSGKNIQAVSASLGSYPSMMELGKDKLVSSKAEAEEMQSKLNKLIEDMDGIKNNDQYNLIVKLIQSDPNLIASFIASPVKLDQEPVYKMENNGSATAPFYIILSIWFGALILIAIIHTGVKPTPEMKDLKTYQKFFGRYLVFFLIGQLQTLITVLGSLLYVGIQCKHPLLFYLAAAFTSFTFTFFLYSLAFAFGNIGEALAVVLMVIQVAGSGGTFPVEVLPKVFQYMYEYMPFAHGMNAIRESIAGLHNKDYLVYLGGMVAYIVVALIFGLVVSIPCQKLNEKIEESKERTDLLL